jgi:hypothetical protein
MSQPAAIIRDPAAADETAWRELWSQYNAFYETDIREPVTAQTWRRILDPASPAFGRLAIPGSAVVGFSISVPHQSTWTIAPVCYLEDLFVAPPLGAATASAGYSCRM